MSETVAAAEKVLGCNVDLQNLSKEKLDWANANSSLCFFPWNTMEIRTNGTGLDVTCCCNLDQSTISDSLDSDPFRAIKEQMNSGILPDSCRACKQEEASGGVSERVKDLITKSTQELEEFKNSRSTKYFELRVNFSSICTLACRSCDAASSSTYAKVTKDFSALHYEKDIGDNEEYFTQIQSIVKENIAGGKKFDLHLMGGEPLLSKGVKKLLDWAVDNNYAKSIDVKITTSLATNIDDYFLQQLDRFRSTTFIASIDSVGENYTYVRWPMKFSKIQNNIEHLREFKTVSPARSKWILCLHPVFSLNNIFYIKEYLNYWNTWFAENENTALSDFYIVSNALLDRTNYLDIQALPVKYRYYLKNLLTECLDHVLFTKLQYRSVVLYTFLKTTLAELDKWPDNQILWNVYLQHTAEFDIRTDTKFAILNKKLYNLLDQQDIDLYNSKILAVKPMTKMIIKQI